MTSETEAGAVDSLKAQMEKLTRMVHNLTDARDSIFVHGHIDGRQCTMLLDTGATKTAVSAVIHGEVQMSITIGRTRIEHRVLVADIEEEFILGVDVMQPHNFNLDLENGVIRVGSDKIVLQYQKDMACCLVLAEDTTVASRTERIVFARLDKKVKEGSILMTEPNSPDDKVSRGILAAKELVKAQDAIPRDQRQPL
ncbi:hypothetical protein QE152_g26784 [Popillia japonica]|uniref:Peptidase A2 domain-containing protein n=1 Tax=Popillia japonica TaxID=7064 RepID=A0AAW1JXN0_POPJA